MCEALAKKKRVYCIPTGKRQRQQAGAAWNSKGCTQMKLIFTSHSMWLPGCQPHTGSVAEVEWHSKSASRRNSRCVCNFKDKLPPLSASSFVVNEIRIVELSRLEGVALSWRWQAAKSNIWPRFLAKCPPNGRAIVAKLKQPSCQLPASTTDFNWLGGAS